MHQGATTAQVIVYAKNVHKYTGRKFPTPILVRKTEYNRFLGSILYRLVGTFPLVLSGVYIG